MKQITVSGHSVEEALEEVKKEYSLNDDEFDYDVIDKGSKGLLGLFSRESVVEVK